MKSKIVNTILIILVVAGLATLAFLVRVGATPDTVAVLEISGMTCGACVADVKKALQAEKGIASVNVDINTRRAIIGYDSKKIVPKTVVSRVAGLGFPCRIVELSSLEKFKAMHGDKAVVPEKAGGCGCCDGSGN